MHPIERYRTARGWTRRELARRAGVSVNTVRSWEAGVMPRGANLHKLAELFDVDFIRLVNSIISWRPGEDCATTGEGVQARGSFRRWRAGF